MKVADYTKIGAFFPDLQQCSKLVKEFDTADEEYRRVITEWARFTLATHQ